MTLIQLKYIMECSRTGSISTAARNLFTSTSNISKLIKNLEDELGYTIFNRTAGGLIPTEPGRELIIHASTILKECGEIEHLRDTYDSKKFSLASVTSSYSCNAFSELAFNHVGENIHIQYNNTTSNDAINLLMNFQCDLAIVAGVSGQDLNTEHMLRHKGIRILKVAEIPTVMYISCIHPILSKYTNDNDILHAVFHYPYIEYNDDMFLSPHPIRPYINPENIIKINERDWRYKIIKMTNGFASGTSLPSDVNSYDWLKEITIPNGEVSFYLAWRNGEEHNPMCCEFIELLKKKIKKDNRYCETLRK